MGEKPRAPSRVPREGRQEGLDGRCLVRLRFPIPVSKRTGERTLLALCSGAQHGASSHAITKREGLRRVVVKMARQSVAVEAAAPSPRTTEWGDGVGRPNATDCS